MPLRILFIADVVGAPGRRALEQRLQAIRNEHEIDACVVNGENAADGIGITPRLADQLLGEGHDPSTIRNTFMGLRALYRRAIARGDAALNPTAGLQLPAVRGRRDRIASVSEADELLAVLPHGDRAL